MPRTRQWAFALALGLLAPASGCALLTPGGADEEFVPPPLTASFTKTPVKIDGVLDDAAWKTAKVYDLALSQDRAAAGGMLTDTGQAMIAWDDEHLYVAVRFNDLDLAAEGEEDQLHHYKLGDLLELFLKPENTENETWYWELYATPTGKKTTFWFPSRGRHLPSCFEKYVAGLRVGATADGTLDNWRDKDRGWTAEMAVPVKDLTARGEKFGPGSTWRILISRYNYTRYLPGKELSMTPAMSRSNYHMFEEYGVIRFEK